MNEVIRRQQPPLDQRRQANNFRDPMSGMKQETISSEDLAEAIREGKRTRRVELQPGQRLPFGYVAPNKTSCALRVGLAVLATVLFIVLAVVWQDTSQKDASASTLLHPCGHGRLPQGAVLGYIDGTIPVFSNCNDQVITGTFAKYRRVGKSGRAAIMCSSVDDAGVETLTPFGEELAEDYHASVLQARSTTHATAAVSTATNDTDAHPKVEAADGETEKMVSEETTATSTSTEATTTSPPLLPLPPAPNCGIRTGMMWQCVELARRYLFLTRGLMFGSVVGAEDIFALTTVFRVIDDADGTEVAEERARSNPSKHILPFDAIPNAQPAEGGLVGGRTANGGTDVAQASPPAAGDLVIWSRQKDMPYGHVAVIVRIDPFVTKEESMFWKEPTNVSEEVATPTIIGKKIAPTYDHLFNKKEDKRAVQKPPRVYEEEMRAAVKDDQLRAKTHAKEGFTGHELERGIAVGEGPSHLSKVREETYEQIVSQQQRQAAQEERAAMIKRYREGVLRPGKGDDSIDQVATVYIAEQNYDSLSYEGRDYGRVLALHKEDVRVGSCKYHLVDPDGYVIKGWMRVGDPDHDG